MSSTRFVFEVIFHVFLFRPSTYFMSFYSVARWCSYYVHCALRSELSTWLVLILLARIASRRWFSELYLRTIIVLHNYSVISAYFYRDVYCVNIAYSTHFPLNPSGGNCVTQALSLSNVIHVDRFSLIQVAVRSWESVIHWTGLILFGWMLNASLESRFKISRK